MSPEPGDVLIKAGQDDFSQLALEMAERSNAARGSDALSVSPHQRSLLLTSAPDMALNYARLLAEMSQICMLGSSIARDRTDGELFSQTSSNMKFYTFLNDCSCFQAGNKQSLMCNS